ncbi:hypothetical protein SESBI_33614 [Sesbania bispinosa]|nr:hypothetical protein SESBI_33614 [Sesbania bispinosa]
MDPSTDHATGGIQSTPTVSDNPYSVNTDVEGGVYGPWMLVKKVPRKKPLGKNQSAATHEKSSHTNNQDSGTRYAILSNEDNQNTDTTQNVDSQKKTEILPDPKIANAHPPPARVRNPKAGKNTQVVSDKRKLQTKPLQKSGPTNSKSGGSIKPNQDKPSSSSTTKGTDVSRKEDLPNHVQLSSPNPSNSLLNNTIIDQAAIDLKRQQEQDVLNLMHILQKQEGCQGNIAKLLSDYLKALGYGISELKPLDILNKEQGFSSYLVINPPLRSSRF